MKKYTNVCMTALIVGILSVGCEGGGGGGGPSSSDITREKWNQVSVPMDYGVFIALFGEPDVTSESGQSPVRGHGWTDEDGDALEISQEVNGRVYTVAVRITEGTTIFIDVKAVCGYGNTASQEGCSEFWHAVGVL
ncbi:MAG: hypothetical protein O3C57_07140 [Verrucomicrobia bacterium]|nr:hypothetical protein [Verrucomicrobiota bacterium]